MSAMFADLGAGALAADSLALRPSVAIAPFVAAFERYESVVIARTLPAAIAAVYRCGAREEVWMPFTLLLHREAKALGKNRRHHRLKVVAIEHIDSNCLSPRSPHLPPLRTRSLAQPPHC